MLAFSNCEIKVRNPNCPLEPEEKPDYCFNRTKEEIVLLCSHLELHQLDGSILCGADEPEKISKYSVK